MREPDPVIREKLWAEAANKGIAGLTHDAFLILSSAFRCGRMRLRDRKSTSVPTLEAPDQLTRG